MVFWICQECGRLHNTVNYEGKTFPIDDWLLEISLGKFGAGTVTGELYCTKCERSVGVIGASRSFFAGFSYRGNVSIVYFNTVEGATRVYPDNYIVTSPPTPAAENEEVTVSEGGE